jgi:hypothetical protein
MAMLEHDSTCAGRAAVRPCGAVLFCHCKLGGVAEKLKAQDAKHDERDAPEAGNAKRLAQECDA